MPLDTFLTKFFPNPATKNLPYPLQLQFLERMSRLLNKGYPLLEALEIVTWDERFADITAEIIKELKNGRPIDVCLKKSGFSKNVVSFLYFARIHSNLDEVFHQCSTMLQLDRTYVNKFKQVIRYPIFLSIFLVIMLVVMDQTIFPALLDLFRSGQESIGLQIAVNLVSFVIGTSKVFLLLLIFLALLWKFKHKKLSINSQIKLFEKIPLIRDYQKIKLTFLFATHFHSILSTGTSMKEALHVISSQNHYPLLAHHSLHILHQLEEGATLAQAIHQCPLFRAELTTIFHKTADLTTMTRDLAVLAEMLTEMTKQKLNKALELIQPIFFVIIAVFILFIYGSIMLPMYQWMNQL
ncbi:ComG operon protein 2 [Thalassobacillus devorans]|uniref:ComG operon protein 2 n=1 Tax=Thalassobacillus devorans TaxID=279813 RepID=A0ABQ1P5R8_9BACI|nr:competence type IV pilus assembly protein ComGB [Thalassobacillus devorans]NIK29626.1 competence protein ComGB [Thalassobacillus devorans]GGC91587.1 ComG operon protein 2 [Thalassobacillus devorans]